MSWGELKDIKVDSAEYEPTGMTGAEITDYVSRFKMALEAILECNVSDGQTMQHIAQVALEGRNGS